MRFAASHSAFSLRFLTLCPPRRLHRQTSAGCCSPASSPTTSSTRRPARGCSSCAIWLGALCSRSLHCRLVPAADPVSGAGLPPPLAVHRLRRGVSRWQPREAAHRYPGWACIAVDRRPALVGAAGAAEARGSVVQVDAVLAAGSRLLSAAFLHAVRHRPSALQNAATGYYAQNPHFFDMAWMVVTLTVLGAGLSCGAAGGAVAGSCPSGVGHGARLGAAGLGLRGADGPVLGRRRPRPGRDVQPGPGQRLDGDMPTLRPVPMTARPGSLRPRGRSDRGGGLGPSSSSSVADAWDLGPGTPGHGRRRGRGQLLADRPGRPDVPRADPGHAHPRPGAPAQRDGVCWRRPHDGARADGHRLDAAVPRRSSSSRACCGCPASSLRLTLVPLLYPDGLLPGRRVAGACRHGRGCWAWSLCSQWGEPALPGFGRGTGHVPWSANPSPHRRRLRFSFVLGSALLLVPAALGALTGLVVRLRTSRGLRTAPGRRPPAGPPASSSSFTPCRAP